MRNLDYLDEFRVFIAGLSVAVDSHNGIFRIMLKSSRLMFNVIASDGDGWDHVSVSTNYRCPRWNEMKEIKDMFFDEEETVVQFHPKKSEYINNDPYCLHMWRLQNYDFPKPPEYMV